MNRFTLAPKHWYAAEFIGEEFGSEIRSYSPIKVDRVTPRGSHTFELAFYHANYPEGVRGKTYTLRTLKRTSTFLLAISTEHEPARLLLIYAMSTAWMRAHFGCGISDSEDVEAWLDKHA
jgi:hypothetical protein